MRSHLFGRFPVLALFTALAQFSLFGQGSAFTYQGRLTDNGSPANGTYDLRFTLYDSGTGGSVLGGPITNTAVAISNGFFTVALDFGAAPFDGNPRWLDIGARANGVASLFTTLAPRQALTAAPYALRAANYSGPIADTQLSGNIGRLNSSQTFTGAINFSNPSNTYAGTLSTASNLTAANFFGNAVNLSNFPPYSIPIWQSAPRPVLAYDTFYDDPQNHNPGTVSATNLLAVAERMQTNGMLAAGWQWIWIDDGWQQPSRDANGNLAPNPTKFPAGMGACVASLHALGFKVGIYSSFGSPVPLTCFALPGTDFSTVQRDMAVFALWGIDGVKMDVCGDGYGPADIAAQPPRFRATANALLNTGRPMVLDFTVESGYATWPIYWEVPYELNLWPATGTFDFIAGFSNIVWAASYVANSPVTPNSAQMKIGRAHV